MSDLIKREDAIEAIEATDWYHQNRNKDMVSGANSDEHQAWCKAEDVYKALEAVTSADTELEIIKAEAYAKGIDSERKRISDWCRPRGEWKPSDLAWGRSIWHCSACDTAMYVPTRRETPMYEYCPYCGARMFAKDTNVPNKEGADNEID